ncbi:unnamed protein product, partial [Prorocentrum cordatum]
PPPPRTACVIATMRGPPSSVLALVERRSDGSHSLVHGSERCGETSAVVTAWRALDEQLGVALAPSTNCNTDRAYYYHYHSVQGNLRQWRDTPGREYVLVSVDDLRRLRFPVASDQRMIRMALEQAEEVERARARAQPEPPPEGAAGAAPASGTAGGAAGADPFVARPSLRITLQRIAGPQHAEERHRLLRERLITLLGVLDTPGDRDARGCTHEDLVASLEESYSEVHLAFLTESRRALAFASGVGPLELTHRPEAAKKLLEEGDHEGALRAALGPEVVPVQRRAEGDPDPAREAEEPPPEEPPPAPAGLGSAPVVPGPAGPAQGEAQDESGESGGSAGGADEEDPDEDPYDWVASWIPEGMAADWVCTPMLPTGGYTIRAPIPTSWVELWKPEVLQEIGHFPPELAAWLDSTIRVGGDEWIQFDGCPRSLDTHRTLPLRLEEGGTETVYYHPKHMLLFFVEAREVYRLMHLVQGPVPQHLRAHRDEQNLRAGRLSPPPLRKTAEPVAGGEADGAAGGHPADAESGGGRPLPDQGAEPPQDAPAEEGRGGGGAEPGGGADQKGEADPVGAASPAQGAAEDGSRLDGPAESPEPPEGAQSRHPQFQLPEEGPPEPEPAPPAEEQGPRETEPAAPAEEQAPPQAPEEPASGTVEELQLQIALEASEKEKAAREAEESPDGPAGDADGERLGRSVPGGGSPPAPGGGRRFQPRQSLWSERGHEEDGTFETRELFWSDAWRQAPRGGGFRHVLQVLVEILVDEQRAGASPPPGGERLFHLEDFSRMAQAGLGPTNGRIAAEYLKDTFGVGVQTNTNPSTRREYRIPEVMEKLQETREAAMRRSLEVTRPEAEAPRPAQGGIPRSPREAGETAAPDKGGTPTSRAREATPEPPAEAILQLEETD